MEVKLPVGRYVVAVSGGVDSVVLLDLLAKQAGLKLVVAHFDHGIRPESVDDRRHVQSLASEYRLPFVYDRAELGPGASEAMARQARYQFLHQVRKASGARAIVTAHHADDRLETAIINMMRGTGRKGLSSLKSRSLVLRPLLPYDKKTIKQYAQAQALIWHEDSTNSDQQYLRNQIRSSLLPTFSTQQRDRLRQHLDTAQGLNEQIEGQLINLLHIQPALDQLDRRWFIKLPHALAKEVMAAWLSRHEVTYDRKALERLVVAAKTFRPGQLAGINRQYSLKVEKLFLALNPSDR